MRSRQARRIRQTAEPHPCFERMMWRHERRRPRGEEIQAMTQFGHPLRLSIACLLAVGLSLPNLCPCAPSMPQTACARATHAPQKARKCGCCTTGGQSCRMPCCRQSPEQDRGMLPAQGSWSVTGIAKAVSPSNSGSADVAPSRTWASALFDPTSRAVTPTLQSQHVCLQI